MLASLVVVSCAPGLGVPGGTDGPTGAVGAVGGTPIPALGITIGEAVGPPPGIGGGAPPINSGCIPCGGIPGGWGGG